MLRFETIDSTTIAWSCDASLRRAAVAGAFLVGAPLVGAAGLVADHVRFGDYGESSVLAFVISGALAGAFALLAGARLLVRN